MPAATHGMYKSPEYEAWKHAKTRCYSTKFKQYADYGGRGIRMCDRWRTSFENFYADMGPRPSKLHTLDRIDNNGNYEPGNCRWATRSEQQYNRRVTGPVRDLKQEAAMRGVSYKGLLYRKRKYGTLDLPTDRKVAPRPDAVIFEGKTTAEWAAELCTSAKNIAQRLRRHGTPYKPVSKHHPR